MEAKIPRAHGSYHVGQLSLKQTKLEEDEVRAERAVTAPCRPVLTLL